jgi:hypothetical protein
VIPWCNNILPRNETAVNTDYNCHATKQRWTEVTLLNLNLGYGRIATTRNRGNSKTERNYLMSINTLLCSPRNQARDEKVEKSGGTIKCYRPSIEQW